MGETAGLNDRRKKFIEKQTSKIYLSGLMLMRMQEKALFVDLPSSHTCSLDQAALSDNGYQ